MSETVTEIDAADALDDDTPIETPRRPMPPMLPTGTGRWRPSAVWLATTTMLLMVTKGPVFRIRFEAAPIAGDFIDDPWVQGAFVLGAGAVIGLCLPAFSTIRADPWVWGSLAMLVGLVVVSGLWSVNPVRTIEQGAMMAVGTLAALLAGATMTRLGLVTALATAMHVGVLASVFARWREWPIALDHNDDLAGIYFNRNSLGPVAIVAAATAIVLLAVAVQRRRWLFVVPLGVLAVLDLTVWWLSGSLTPVFAVLVAGTTVAVFGLAIPGPRQQLRRSIAVAVGGGGVVIAVLALALRGQIATRLDRSPTLTGRTEIWDVVLQYVGERPIHGYGFLAAWTRPGLVEELGEQYGRQVYEAHSGFFEVLLGVGVIGLVALVVAVAVALHRSGRAAWRAPDLFGLFLFALVVYAVAVNLGETMVGANLLPWVLLSAVAGRAVADLCERSP